MSQMCSSFKPLPYLTELGGYLLGIFFLMYSYRFSIRSNWRSLSENGELFIFPQPQLRIIWMTSSVSLKSVTWWVWLMTEIYQKLWAKPGVQMSWEVTSTPTSTRTGCRKSQVTGVLWVGPVLLWNRGCRALLLLLLLPSSTGAFPRIQLEICCRRIFVCMTWTVLSYSFLFNIVFPDCFIKDT